MTIPVGSREVTLDIPTYDNDDLDVDRYFTVTIHDAVNATIDPNGDEKVVTIIDKQSVSATGNIVAMTVVNDPIEGSAATIRIDLDRPSSINVIAYVTTNDGTAIGGATCGAGVDYTELTSYPVTIARGTQSAVFYVATCDNNLVDGSRVFEVEIVDVLGGTYANIATNPVDVTIRDNDSHPVLSFVALTPVTEGDKSTLTFSLDKPAVGDVTFDYATTGSGSAIADTDYDSVTATTVTIPDGETTPSATDIATHFIQTNQGISSSPVDFFVQLSGLSTNVTYPNASATRIEIVESGVPTLTVTAASVIAGNLAPVKFNLSNAPLADVIVEFYTEDDSAISPTDYDGITQAAPETVTFTPTDWTEKTFSIQTKSVGNTSSVKFDVKIASHVNAKYDGNDVPVVINPAATQANLSMTSDVSQVPEGSVFTLQFNLDQALGNEVTFTISTANGTATGGDDYEEFALEPIRIPAGDTYAEKTLDTYTNLNVTTNVTFTVAVDQGSVVGAVDQTSTLTLTIIDDSAVVDPNLTVTFPQEVTKGNQAILNFSLNTVSTKDVTFKVTTAVTGTGAGHATVGTGNTFDVEYKTQDITIPANGSTSSFTIETYDDASGVDMLTFQVEITDVINANDHTSGPLVITLRDPIAAGNPVLTTSAPSRVVEGTLVQVELVLDRAPSAPVTVTVNTADGTASALGGDYTATVNQIITFGTTDTRKTTTIQTSNTNTGAND